MTGLGTACFLFCFVGHSLYTGDEMRLALCAESELHMVIQ